MLLPAGLSASAVADRLAGEVPVVTQKAHTIERVFWDTFDGRVRGARARAGRQRRAAHAERRRDVHRTRERRAEARHGAAARRRPARRPAGRAPRRSSRCARSLPVVRLQQPRASLANVLDDDAKTVVRGASRRRRPAAGGRARSSCDPRLHAQPACSATTSALERDAARCSSSDLGLHPAGAAGLLDHAAKRSAWTRRRPDEDATSRWIPADRADHAAVTVCVALARGQRRPTSTASWRTSTASSCTTCASRCAARARCCAN